MGFAIYYWLIRDIGVERTVTVNFLVPLFAQIWGVVFLQEIITWRVCSGAVWCCSLLRSSLNACGTYAAIGSASAPVLCPARRLHANHRD